MLSYVHVGFILIVDIVWLFDVHCYIIFTQHSMSCFIVCTFVLTVNQAVLPSCAVLCYMLSAQLVFQLQHIHGKEHCCSVAFGALLCMCSPLTAVAMAARA